MSFCCIFAIIQVRSIPWDQLFAFARHDDNGCQRWVLLDLIERRQKGSDELGVVPVLAVGQGDDGDRVFLFPLQNGASFSSFSSHVCELSGYRLVHVYRRLSHVKSEEREVRKSG